MSEKQEIPPPILLSAIICDMVILDAIMKRPSIIGVFETISAPSYPARHPWLAFFCQLTEGRSKTKVTVKLVDVQQNDAMMLEQKVEQEFIDVRQVANLIFNFGGIVFPHSGEYRFQIYAGTEILGERRIICSEVKLPSGGQNNEQRNP
jgi:hypothetical protein